jgi:hypothetical protein
MTIFDEISPTDLAIHQQRFEREGFLVIKNYLGTAELEQLRDRAVPLARSLLRNQNTTI